MNSPDYGLTLVQKLSATRTIPNALRVLLNIQQNFAASVNLSAKVNYHWRQKAA